MTDQQPVLDPKRRSVSSLTRTPLRVVSEAEPTPAADSAPEQPPHHTPAPPPRQHISVRGAVAQARQLGLFTGPTWTVLLTAGPDYGGALLPFIIRARDPELAQAAAAAVIRTDSLTVIGVIPGDHRPLPGTPPRPADEITAAHREAAAAARAVFDSRLAELAQQSQPADPLPPAPGAIDAADSPSRTPGVAAGARLADTGAHAVSR